MCIYYMYACMFQELVLLLLFFNVTGRESPFLSLCVYMLHVCTHISGTGVCVCVLKYHREGVYLAPVSLYVYTFYMYVLSCFRN